MENKLFRTNENFKSVNWGINVVVPLLYEKPRYFVVFFVVAVGGWRMAVISQNINWRMVVIQ